MRDNVFMEKLKKLFGQYEMTWKRLIIFSVLCGVYTAAVLLTPGVNETALREIGVGYECWFILAVFVVSNCKNAKEAAIKCFVFFLISQPLVYLVQMFFMDRNLLKDYYYPWFIKTLLTLPGGFIAYQIKRRDVLGAVILAVAGLYLAFFGGYCLVGSISPLRISYLIYGLFLTAAAILLGFIFCDAKKLRMIYMLIVLAGGIGINAYISSMRSVSGEYEMELSKENWNLTNCRFEYIDAEIDDDVLIIKYTQKNASGQLTLTNENDEERYYTVAVENGELKVTEVDEF